MSSETKPSKAQQLYAKYKDARAAEKQAAYVERTKRMVILGGIVEAAARNDSNFKNQFAALVAEHAREQDKKYLTEWLPQQQQLTE